MQISSNSDLKKVIDNYEKNNLIKRKELFIRIITTFFTTAIGCVVTPIIGIHLDEVYKPIWPIIITGSLATGLILQYNIIKSMKRRFEKSKDKLTSIVNILTKRNILVDEKTIANSLITIETTKVLKNALSSTNILETTIKKFYFLDNLNQIRILKEVKQTIINENKKKETTSRLYYEDVQNEEELPVRKTLRLELK